MTDYDLFPAIRFQFDGDNDQAVRRIPQARALMQQLVRRMEASEIDTLQWRVQAADGTYFELQKNGDQHIAYIRAPEFIPEPPAPKPQEIPPFELEPDQLIRTKYDYYNIVADGAGNGDYLWVGARSVIKQDLIDNLTEIDFINRSPGSPEPFQRYSYDGNPVTWEEKEGNFEQTFGEKYIDSLTLPVINLMLFEPGWSASRNTGKIMQSGLCNLYAGYPIAYDSFNYNNYFTPSLDNADSWPTWGEGGLERTLFVNDIEHTVTRTDTLDGVTYEQSIPAYYTWIDAFLSTQNKCVSTYPYQFVPEEYQGTCHTYLLLNANESAKVVPYELNETYAGTEGTVYCRRVGEPYAFWEKDVTLIYDTRQPPYFRYLYSHVEYEYLSSFQQATPPELPATQDVNILAGLYELRVSIGDIHWPNQVQPYPDEQNYSVTYPIPVIDTWDIEVYIKNGANSEIKTYPVTINFDPDQYVFGETSFIFKGDDYENSGIPTSRFMWYQGAWLIDIKNGTIIHETNPANLQRPWFT